MNAVVPKVAVVGSGISGSVCASFLSKNGIPVTLFESARGPGGRTSQRRETLEDGKELVFDHGAPYFNVTHPDVLNIVHNWESRGIISEWKEKFGTFDCISRKFSVVEKDLPGRTYVGVPGMNSVCKKLCHEPGIDSKFGVGVGKMEWSASQNVWSLIGVNGELLGDFGSVVVSDKSVASRRFAEVTGRPPPLAYCTSFIVESSCAMKHDPSCCTVSADLSSTPELASRMHEIPVRPCFALMMAFSEPLSSVPAKGISFINSEVISAAFCDSSKPGRSTTSERWVLHSTAEYANRVIAEAGLKKPSNAVLTKVAEELLKEFQSTGLVPSQPYFMKAHRWGSAFPAARIAGEEKCLWDEVKRLAICGDFCVSPKVEGAIRSGLAAASKVLETLSCM